MTINRNRHCVQIELQNLGKGLQVLLKFEKTFVYDEVTNEVIINSNVLSNTIKF
jgi:hypothetical protein